MCRFFIQVFFCVCKPMLYRSKSTNKAKPACICLNAFLELTPPSLEMNQRKSSSFPSADNTWVQRTTLIKFPPLFWSWHISKHKGDSAQTFKLRQLFLPQIFLSNQMFVLHQQHCTKIIKTICWQKWNKQEHGIKEGEYRESSKKDAFFTIGFTPATPYGPLSVCFFGLRIMAVFWTTPLTLSP